MARTASGGRSKAGVRKIAALCSAAALSRVSAQDAGTCAPCVAEQEPAAGEFPTSLNGVKWPTLCLNTNETGKDHFFTIGDWGGMGRYPPRTFDNTRKKRPYDFDLDANAQMNVAKVMKDVAKSSRPQYVINVGDNFYPSGLETKCGQTSMCNVIHTGQWQNVFEKVYDGPDLVKAPWMGTLGNHDWGGWQFNKGWDQSIAYTWHSDRWITPALYWERRVQYCTTSVDFFFVDSNIMDAFPSQHDQDHNLCSSIHNVDSNCGKVSGPSDAETCHKWFRKLDNEQKAWLEKRLAQSDADWQVIVTHFTPQYGANYWEKIAAKYGVDLFISGHRHQQEMHYKDNVIKGMGDTAWIVTGGGGGVTSEGNPKFEGPKIQQYGFMDVTVSKETLVVDMWSHTGKKWSSTAITPRTTGGTSGDDAPAPSASPSPAVPISGDDAAPAACGANPGCASLEGNCCPNDEGVMLGCCKSRLLEAEELAVEEQPLQQLPGSRRLDSQCEASRRRGSGSWSGSARRRDIRNYAQNCWSPCGSRAGYCPSFCGEGNACCRAGSTTDPIECVGATFPVPSFHTCVQPVGNRLVEGNDGPVLMAGIGPDDVEVKYDPEALKMQADLMREDCLAGCGQAGLCPFFCGAGRACCKKNDPSDPVECHSANVYGFITEHHECVMVMGENVTGEPSWGVSAAEVLPAPGAAVRDPSLGLGAVNVGAEASMGASNTLPWWAWLLVSLVVVAVAGCLAIKAGLFSGEGSKARRTKRRAEVSEAESSHQEEAPLMAAAPAALYPTVAPTAVVPTMATAWPAQFVPVTGVQVVPVPMATQVQYLAQQP